MNPSELNAFQRWVADMAHACGIELPAPLDPLGLELHVEGRVARIMAHTDDSLAVVEVDVLGLYDCGDEELGTVSVALLKLNQEARFEHGWAIVLDEQDRLSITSTVVMASTAAQALNELVADGLERAQALAEAVSAMVDPALRQVREDEANTGTSALTALPMPDSGFIRG